MLVRTAHMLWVSGGETDVTGGKLAGAGVWGGVPNYKCFGNFRASFTQATKDAINHFAFIGKGLPIHLARGEFSDGYSSLKLGLERVKVGIQAVVEG
jgi:hypothetical protein